MPNLRTSRQRLSRTSSPFVRTANTSPAPEEDVKKNRQQGSLDAWVEPAPRSPVPSFVDHGMERTMLFQDMAPLGAMPPQRLKLKIKGDVRGEKAESLPPSDVATATPETTPPPAEIKTSESISQEAAAEEQKRVEMKQEEKTKEEPRDAVMAEVPPLPSAAPTPKVPRSPAVQNGTSTPGHSRHTSKSKIVPPSPSPSRQPNPLSNMTRAQKMEKVVRKAIELASSTPGQEKLAAVINKFYEETFTNPPLADLFDAVITKSETDAQKVQFQHEMKRIRKLVQREAKQGSRSRTMSASATPNAAGYSSQPPTIASTMGSTTMGSHQPQQLNFLPPNMATRPYQRHDISTQERAPASPFSAFRGVLQPSPSFSPTHSLSASPTLQQPQQSFSQGRAGIAPANPPIHQNTPNFAPKTQILTPQTKEQIPPSSTKSQAHPQPNPTMAVSTRRSARAANVEAAAPTPAPATDSATAINDTISVADHGAQTNGVKKFASEEINHLIVPSPIKQASKSPRSGKSRRRRSQSADSVSSLSSVDEHVVERGAPLTTSTAATESQVPSRAVSRSNTPKPGVGPKAKVKKGSNLKHLAGSKRGASETIAIEEADEETRERRTRAKANFDKQLEDRKSEHPPEPDFTSYRESEEYLSALPSETVAESRRTRTTRRQSAPDTSKVTSTRSSTAAATPATSAPSDAAAGTRRARQSTRDQRAAPAQIDVVANAPRLEVQTPSTPAEPLSEAESNGDPPPKRRKTARTKFSPVKPPNGTALTRRSSPSRSSPMLDSGREGKKPNRDVCYACGCGGELVCCDMCQNSFHAGCWDPPCADASDEPFQGFEWICTHCRIWDKRKENEERSKKGEPMLIDTSDEESDFELDDDVPTTPPDWNLVDLPPLEVPLFKSLINGFKELLPEQFELKPMLRDAYDGYVADSERRFRPTQKAPITVDSRLKPTEVLFDEGKQIKDPKDMKQCVYCGLSAVSKKGDLIKCDTCGDFWHTDCLPTPTTAPPQTWSAQEKRGNRTTDVFKKRYWECPRHIDQDMILLTDPIYYAGNPKLKRGIKVRLPRKQVQQVAAIKAGLPEPQSTKTRRVREAPSDVMHVNIEVDDTWWEKYDTRKNEIKETENREFTLHENNILADFAAKAMNSRVELAQSNGDFIDALVPNTYSATHIKKQWADRIRAEIDTKVQKEVEVAMILAGLQQQKSGINVNDLFSAPSQDDVVNRLAGSMTTDQIKQMQALLAAVENKIKNQPALATAQQCKKLDDDMDTILFRRKEVGSVDVDGADDDVPSAKRQKTDGASVTPAGTDEDEI